MFNKINCSIIILIILFYRMSKLYIRGFGDEIDEAQLKRQFGKKRIDRVDLIEKRDETGAIAWQS